MQPEQVLPSLPRIAASIDDDHAICSARGGRRLDRFDIAPCLGLFQAVGIADKDEYAPTVNKCREQVVGIAPRLAANPPELHSQWLKPQVIQIGRQQKFMSYCRFSGTFCNADFGHEIVRGSLIRQPHTMRARAPEAGIANAGEGQDTVDLPERDLGLPGQLRRRIVPAVMINSLIGRHNFSVPGTALRRVHFCFFSRGHATLATLNRCR